MRPWSTALATVALLLAAAAPAAADNIHFYVYEDPGQPGRARVMTVVKDYPAPSEQQIGTCRNVHGTGDLVNHTDNVLYLYALPNCGTTAQFPARRINDGERVPDAAFQSVHVGQLVPPGS
ncbi:hypothetical protein ACIQOU_30905 [Streptomyces sp. NPDC091279]|uniref:hypothetical protein n=1 Tax=unclassified Streptomyces TaxID=2593676 RepID=UPI0037F7A846